MTVKHRLTISSILMIAILFVVASIIVEGGRAVFFEKNDAGSEEKMIDARFFRVLQFRIQAKMEKWTPETNEAEILADAARFAREYEAHHVYWYIFKNGQLLNQAPTRDIQEFLGLVPSTGDDQTFITGNKAMFASRFQEYEVKIVTDHYISASGPDRETLFYYYVTVSVTTMVLTLILINFLLSRFIFRRIMSSINTLSYGVRQIRDGNLDYRIDYTQKDEFAPACHDFNEMAWRLKDSVEKSLRDEQSRKELMAGISHDLRTPLTSIKAYIEGLDSGVASTPDMRKRYMGTIKAKSEELERLIHKLFLFSKLDTGTFPLVLEKVDICTELGALAASVHDDYAQAGLDIIYKHSESRAFVQADITQLHNALFNILENSLKYKNKERGRMEIACRSMHGAVEVRLDDDGPGVPDCDLDRIFDVFYRCDPARGDTGKSSGLGLAITASIMKQLGGAIRAEKSGLGGLSIIMNFPSAGAAHEQDHSDH